MTLNNIEYLRKELLELQHKHIDLRLFLNDENSTSRNTDEFERDLILNQANAMLTQISILESRIKYIYKREEK